MYEDIEEPWDEIDPHEDMGLNHLIDGLLNGARPDRYYTNDRRWMDNIVQTVAEELERRPSEASEAARRLVHQREGQATKSANRALRRIAQEGTLPIGWGNGRPWEQIRADLLSPPLSINGERVRLGAASPDDLFLWRQVRERDAEKRLSAEAETWRGADLLIRWAREQGVHRVEDLRNLPASNAA